MAFKIQKPKLGNQLFTFRVLFYIFHRHDIENQLIYIYIIRKQKQRNILAF